MMPIFACDLCPVTFVTQGELTSHKHRYHIIEASTSASFQQNQGGARPVSGTGTWIHPCQNPESSLQINHVRVLNSALMPGDEVLVAANTIYWLSRDRKCTVECSQSLNLKLEASDGPPTAKRHHGASKTAPLVLGATRKVYRCDECPMVFSSYHALGGHKSGHRKAEARLRSAAEQLNKAPLQPQPQEALPPAPPSLQQPKYLLDLNETPSK
jgi:C2H2-type zinc finger